MKKLMVILVLPLLASCSPGSDGGGTGSGETRMGSDGDTVFGEMGRWVLERDRHRVSPHGSGEGTGWFPAREDGSLRMLDRGPEEMARFVRR
jgi:hypothetical protein